MTFEIELEAEATVKATVSVEADSLREAQKKALHNPVVIAQADWSLDEFDTNTVRLK